MGIQDLKNMLREYLEEVRQGEEILVTDHGEVVAELRRPTWVEAGPPLDSGLGLLARRGILTLGKANSPALYVPLPPLMAAGSAAELLSEERRERR